MLFLRNFSGCIIHPLGLVLSFIVCDLLTLTPVSRMALTHSFSDLIGFEHYPLIKMEEDLVEDLSIRSVHGHSINGLKLL